MWSTVLDACLQAIHGIGSPLQRYRRGFSTMLIPAFSYQCTKGIGQGRVCGRKADSGLDVRAYGAVSDQAIEKIDLLGIRGVTCGATMRDT
jgi:hypothetical protein